MQKQVPSGEESLGDEFTALRRRWELSLGGGEQPRGLWGEARLAGGQSQAICRFLWWFSRSSGKSGSISKEPSV